MDAHPDILVIDDDTDIHAAIRMIFEPLGLRVVCCSTGPEGLEQAVRAPPRVILLDIMLSSLSEGFHLAYELKRNPATSRIPIIMVSAIGDAIGIDYSKETGSDYLPAAAFVTKPFDAATLRRTVDQVLHAQPV